MCPKNLLLCSCSPFLCSIDPLIYSSSSAICLEISKHYRSAYKRCKTNPCNYRPISLLPIISKVMESIIASDIKSFLFSNGSDFMPSIEDLHPLLGEQKQHIQGRVTWSLTKLMIGNQAIGEEEGFHVGRDDGFHYLANDWEKADWSVVAGIPFCTFLCRAVMFADLQTDGR